MAPRVLHDDGGSRPLTKARRRQQGLDSPDSCPSARLQRSSAPPAPTAVLPPGSSAPLLTPIKGRPRALVQRLVARRGRDDARRPLAPSHVDACNPLLQAHPTWARDNTKAEGFPFTPVSHWFPPFALRLAPTHLGWGTQRQFTRRSRDPPGVETPTVGAPGRGLLRVDEQLPVKLQMGSLLQPFQPGTLLRFGSLEFMSLDGGYDMILLPPPHDSDNGGRQPTRRRRNRRRLPHVAEEQHSGLSRRLPRRRGRRRGNQGQAGGGTSSAVERVDGVGAPTGDTSSVDLASETKTSVVSPQHANSKRRTTPTRSQRTCWALPSYPRRRCSLPLTRLGHRPSTRRYRPIPISCLLDSASTHQTTSLRWKPS
jgi:hypothetical protein